MIDQFNYNQRMDIKYDHQELIDVDQVVRECRDKWFVVAAFTRDEKGKVDGINMQHVRMIHHRFEKVR